MNIHVEPEVEKFLNSLDKETAAKTAKTIDLLEKFGNELRMPHSKKVAEKIFELRIVGKPEVRILYAFHTGAAFLLHGFVKKTQKLPPKNLSMAVRKWKDIVRG